MKIQKVKKCQHSIRTRIVLAFLLFAVLQFVLFFVLIYATGILKSVYEQPYSVLNSRVTVRAGELSETMNNAKSGFIPVAKQLGKSMNEGLKNGKEPSDLLEEAAEYLIEYLNVTRDASGVFAILESEDNGNYKDCVYIRDNSYGGFIRSADSKIYVCGPSSIAKKYNFQLFHLWEQRLNFSALGESGSADFYTKPMIAAKNFNSAYSDMYYWSKPFRLTESDTGIITFSLPLNDENGSPFGVCGFEISSDFIKKMLPYNELSGNYNFYAVDIDNGSGYISTGTAPTQFKFTDFYMGERINNTYNSIRATVQSPSPAMSGIEKTLEIYNSSAVYQNEKWLLYGFTDENFLLEYPRSLTYYLVSAQIIILLTAIIYIIAVSVKFARPIKELSEIIKSVSVDTDDILALPATSIREIDELAKAIQVMNKAAVASASRLNTLLEMTDISMGGYDVYCEGDIKTVFLTNSMSGLIGLDDSVRSVEKTEWDAIMNKLGLLKSGDVSRFIDRRNGAERWLRLMKIDNPENRFNESGIIMDVSGEITVLRKTQYERDYDALTQAMNRRAFYEALGERIENGVYEAGALIIIDLDNLKYINDSYGHETGDAYLIKTAETLKEFEQRGALISRMAGDEFILFVPCEGSDRKEYISLKTDIFLMLERCKTKSIPLPDGEKQRIRFTAGIAWYPDDAEDLSLLTRYADFALYELKHNIKGSVSEFNLDAFNKKSYLVSKREAFDHLVETEGFRYMLQPVTDGKTGEVFAYEMLIRSETEGLKTPYEILSIAKQQSKLYYLEIIGLKSMFRLLSENENRLKGKIIFYNIIKSIVLKQEDWEIILGSYKQFFPQAVIEISEDGEFNEAVFAERERHIKTSGLKMSLDNFGSGYNSEALLERINPSYVKLSMSLVRDINLNANKRAMVKNITEYCAARGVKTIAQGVETYGEMQTASELGIDYYQGNYLALPSYEITDIPQNIKKQIIKIARKHNR